VKWYEIRVARSCSVAWGGRATFLPGAAENSKLYSCACECVWVALGHVGVGFRTRRSQTLIPKLMYLLRVNAKTQINRESLNPRENTIKEIPVKVARNKLFVRQQTREVGMAFGIKDSKWGRKKELEVSSKD